MIQLHFLFQFMLILIYPTNMDGYRTITLDELLEISDNPTLIKETETSIAGYTKLYWHLEDGSKVKTINNLFEL